MLSGWSVGNNVCSLHDAARRLRNGGLLSRKSKARLLSRELADVSCHPCIPQRASRSGGARSAPRTWLPCRQTRHRQPPSARAAPTAHKIWLRRPPRRPRPVPALHRNQQGKAHPATRVSTCQMATVYGTSAACAHSFFGAVERQCRP